MMDSLYIKNFRIFKEFQIKSVNRINLFVGTNNTGKSCLLEAIYLYANGPDSLFEIIKSRDEDWESYINKKDIRYENPVRHIFNGYHLPELGDDKNGIEIGSLTEAENRINLNLVAYKYITKEDGVGVRKQLSREDLLTEIEDFFMGLEFKYKNQNPLLMRIDNSLTEIRRRSHMLASRLNIKDDENIQMVPAQNVSHKDIAMLWDNINLTDLEEEVITCLKIIEPRTTGIGLVGERNERIPIIKLKDSDERLPLKAFGDGMNRLFSIILALVNAKNGILLIDEVENGLHWSVHPKLWKIIFTLAEKLNVQVFATTHSRDCVEGFNTVWAGQEDDAFFFRLEKKEDQKIRTVHYDQEELADTLETGVEFR